MKRLAHCRQRGMTMLMVLILMTVMLLGSLGLARLTEASYLITGNVAARDGSLHAAEVGLNTAMLDIANTIKAAEAVAITNWYWPTPQASDATTGIPTVSFDVARQVAGNVGRYEVRYVIERMCTVTTVSNSSLECLSKPDPTQIESRNHVQDDLVGAAIRQFRITIRVTDQRGTQTWTQALVS